MSYSYDNRRRLVLTQGEGYRGTLSGSYVDKTIILFTEVI